MQFSIKLYTIKTGWGWSIVFLSLKYKFDLVNEVDIDEMPHSLLGLHCLQIDCNSDFWFVLNDKKAF